MGVEAPAKIEGLSEEFLKKNGKYMELIRGFRLLDDDFMSKVFEDPACAELLLRILLEREDLTVREVHGQYSLKNLQGRSVRLDILAVDEKGITYNVEIQRRDEGADARRARYNSSLLDANLTDHGERYSALGETYVIFITERDVLKAGLPVYHIERTVRETGKPFGDGSHILYVNAQIRDETALGRLMHDFACTKAEEMHYPLLAERVRYFKEDAKGAANMCRAVEKLVDESRVEGRQESVLESIRALMSSLAVPAERAMELLKIPEAEQEKLAALLEQSGK